MCIGGGWLIGDEKYISVFLCVCNTHITFHDTGFYRNLLDKIYHFQAVENRVDLNNHNYLLTVRSVNTNNNNTKLTKIFQ